MISKYPSKKGFNDELGKNSLHAKNGIDLYFKRQLGSIETKTQLLVGISTKISCSYGGQTYSQSNFRLLLN